MPTKTTQTSTVISEETSLELERYTNARGLKKAYVIEQALRYHLRALKELPANVIVPAQLVVAANTGAHLAERMKKPRKPTPDMRALFAKK
jgi:hypothetical protein